VEPFLVAASTNLIMAQRLCRKICAACKEELALPRGALVDLGFSAEEAKAIKSFKGKGCMACSETGYKGRIAIYEVMLINEQIKDGVLQGASVAELREFGRANGMKTLREAGLQKIREGVTTIQEIMRVTSGS
jgi:type IV pilus assembly protein PilB